MGNNLGQLVQTPFIQPGTKDLVNWPWLQFLGSVGKGSNASGVVSLNALTGALSITVAGGLSIIASGNTIQISAGGIIVPTFAYNETPSNPSMDNQNFVLAHTPNPAGSLQLWLRGDNYPTQPLFPDGVDYALTTNLIAMNNVLTGTYELLAPFYQF